MNLRYLLINIVVTIVVASLMALFITTRACADDGNWIARMGGISHHLRNDNQHNDLNIGPGLEYRQSAALGFAAGLYHNSEYRTSTYGLVRYQPLELGPFRIGVLAGVVTGYVEHPVMPALIPAISTDIGRLNVSIVFVPNFVKVDGCISLQLGWRI